MQYMNALWNNSVKIPSKDTEKIGRVAGEVNAYVLMGCNELSEGGTLYNTQFLVNKKGELEYRHRKLMPTYTERMYWGFGDGSDLNVCETDIGRVGSLICWEHHMILIRAAMIHKDEDFHVANWPGN